MTDAEHGLIKLVSKKVDGKNYYSILCGCKMDEKTE